MGVEIVYPLSENTVLVIQQLFANLRSAVFIPIFKALKDIGKEKQEEGMLKRPQYTFSFYFLIVLHMVVAIFFATCKGWYFWYEAELEKKAKEEEKRGRRAMERTHSRKRPHVSGGQAIDRDGGRAARGATNKTGDVAKRGRNARVARAGGGRARKGPQKFSANISGGRTALSSND